MSNKHAHYYKNVEHLDTIDVYRVLELFNVTDPCLQHAIKKLLVAGGRGAGKDNVRDIEEAKDSLKRYLQMRDEDGSDEHIPIDNLIGPSEAIDMSNAFEIEVNKITRNGPIYYTTRGWRELSDRCTDGNAEALLTMFAERNIVIMCDTGDDTIKAKLKKD